MSYIIYKNGVKYNEKGKKLCVYGDCDIEPSFNYGYKKETLYCKEHKLESMMDVFHRRKTCSYDRCDLYPLYNYKGRKTSKYCKYHKKDFMIDVMNRLCDKCELTRVKFDNLCMRCWYYNNPRHKRTLNIYSNRRVIEQYFINVITNDLIQHSPNLVDNNLSVDINYNGGPDQYLDLFVEFDTFVLVVQFIENQQLRDNYHHDKPDIFNGREIRIIKFNVDEYLDKDNIKIASCFKYDRSHKKIQNKKSNIKDRSELLVSTVNNMIKADYNGDLIVELYYDII